MKAYEEGPIRKPRVAYVNSWLLLLLLLLLHTMRRNKEGVKRAYADDECWTLSNWRVWELSTNNVKDETKQSFASFSLAELRSSSSSSYCAAAINNFEKMNEFLSIRATIVCFSCAFPFVFSLFVGPSSCSDKTNRCCSWRIVLLFLLASSLGLFLFFFFLPFFLFTLSHWWLPAPILTLAPSLSSLFCCCFFFFFFSYSLLGV